MWPSGSNNFLDESCYLILPGVIFPTGQNCIWSSESLCIIQKVAFSQYIGLKIACGQGLQEVNPKRLEKCKSESILLNEIGALLSFVIQNRFYRNHNVINF